MAIFNSLKKRLKSKPTLQTQQEVVRGLITAKIYALLQQANLSKTELAQRMGISKPAISGLMSGNRNFTIDKLTEIAYLFNLTPKIDFVPLNARHEASIVGITTPIIEVKTKEETTIIGSSDTLRIASNNS